ncbi:MAG: LacI family DNA-binding transcriptional regulator [Janthinobacterium lividum]
MAGGPGPSGGALRTARQHRTDVRGAGHLAKPPARPQRRSTTISDVAQRAGVSPMTVSRVINGETNVRQTTRDTVNAAIAALRYSPNPAAQSLAGAQPIKIGMLYSNPSAAYLSEFLVGTLDYASRANIQLVIEKCDVGDEAEAAARHLLAGGVDGLVLPPPLCDTEQVLAVLRAAGALGVTVASGHPAPGFSAFSIDDHRAAYEMTAHIISLGHQRIGFIVGDREHPSSLLRLAGFRAAMAAAGLDVPDALIKYGLFTYRSGLDAAEELIGVDNPPSAIFASNDDMAAATVAVAHRHGIDVPSDLTVCGFDDTALATTIWPELTTIRQPIADMSLAAVELLVREIRAYRAGEPMTPQHLQLDFKLIRRQSDAAPRRRPSIMVSRP